MAEEPSKVQPTKVQPTKVQPTENQQTEVKATEDQSGDVSTNAYAQWISLLIINSSKEGTISVKNAKLSWGKFYKWDNKNNEISTGDVNKITITAGEQGRVSSSGRSNASSGTEGGLDLYDGSTKILHVKWDVPWGSKTNNFAVSDQSRKFYVTVGDWNDHDGAIGSVSLEIEKKP